MQQTLLRIGLPDKAQVWPSDFRTLVAALDGHDPSFYARDDQGATVRYPGIKFCGGPRWCGVLADAAHEPVLMRQAGMAIKALATKLGQPLPANFETHEFGLARTQYPIAYRATNMVLKRRGPAARDCSLEELAAARIQSSLRRTADHYGIDCPTDSEMELMGLTVEHNAGIRIKDDAAEFGTVASVSFSMFVELKGYWFVGNLTARGHGRVIRQMSHNLQGPAS